MLLINERNCTNVLFVPDSRRLQKFQRIKVLGSFDRNPPFVLSCGKNPKKKQPSQQVKVHGKISQAME